MFPLAFLCGTFVLIAGMSLIPREIADYNPLAAIVAAIRHLTQGTTTTGSWPLEHPVPAAVTYCAVITAACLPLAARKFGKA